VKLNSKLSVMCSVPNAEIFGTSFQVLSSWLFIPNRQPFSPFSCVLICVNLSMANLVYSKAVASTTEARLRLIKANQASIFFLRELRTQNHES
jgi:hypothetical protein